MFLHYYAAHHLTAIRMFLLLLQYGYVVLFPIAVIEGPIAAIVAGALVASRELNGYVVFALLVIADLLGDFLYYSLGRWGKIAFLERLGARLGLSEKRLEPLKESFRRNDWRLLLVGKTQALGSIILYFAGVTRMKLDRFFFWNLVGTIPKVLLFEAIGYLFGSSLVDSHHYLSYLTIGMFAGASVLLIAYFCAKYYLERELAETMAP